MFGYNYSKNPIVINQQGFITLLKLTAQLTNLSQALKSSAYFSQVSPTSKETTLQIAPCHDDKLPEILPKNKVLQLQSSYPSTLLAVRV